MSGQTIRIGELREPRTEELMSMDISNEYLVTDYVSGIGWGSDSVQFTVVKNSVEGVGSVLVLVNDFEDNKQLEKMFVDLKSIENLLKKIQIPVAYYSLILTHGFRESY